MEDHSFLQTSQELTDQYERNADMVYRLCRIYLKNSADADDAVQSVFLNLIKSKVVFCDLEHEKAWLITATRNHCKNILKNWWRTRRVDLENLPEIPCYDDADFDEVRKRLLLLPEKYQSVLYLYYYEGYPLKEIARILGQNESTVRTRLSRGLERLKIDLGDGEYV